jgi:hypothetical protein
LSTSPRKPLWSLELPQVSTTAGDNPGRNPGLFLSPLPPAQQSGQPFSGTCVSFLSPLGPQLRSP